jgi:excisionase family DNA binding protein
MTTALDTTVERPSSWPVVESVVVGYMTLPQTGEYLGVSTATVRRWIKKLALPHYHVPGAGGKRGKLLFRRGELDRWMRRFRNGLQAHEGWAALHLTATTL